MDCTLQIFLDDHWVDCAQLGLNSSPTSEMMQSRTRSSMRTPRYHRLSLSIWKSV